MVRSAAEAMEHLTITLLGQSYQIACPVEEQGLVQEAVTLLQGQIETVRARGRAASKERTVLMVAVNLAADLMRARQSLQAQETALADLEKRLRVLVDTARAEG